MLLGTTIVLVLSVISYVELIPSDIDCSSCDAEECAEDKTIPCCKHCLAHIKCTPNEMLVTIPRAVARLALDDLSFAESSCGGTLDGQRYIFRTGMTQCGTKTVFIRNTHVMYKNEIRHRNGKPLYSLTCLFKRRVSPARRHVRVKTPNKEATRMYHTSVRGRRQYDSTVYADDKEHFFFEIKGPSYLESQSMQMAVRTCQFDITENSNIPGDNPRTDVLIRNG